MATYIVTLMAKSGHEKQVTKFYLSQDDALKAAPGFGGRSIFQAQTGTMLKAVLAGMTQEEREKFASRGDDGQEEKEKGTQFVMIETWDSIDDRMAFAKQNASQRSDELIPHLLPDNTHEFYQEIT